MAKGILKYFRRRKGQTALEYCVIQMLIIVAIMLMGPHLVRSVNAYFRGAEEQAQASYQEDFVQAAF